MKWIKMELKTTTEAVDLVSSMLDDLGVEGIEISDYVPLSEEDKQKMFIDILPELPEDDGSATVSFYLDTDTNIEELKANIAVELSELRQFVNVGSGELSVSETEDKDWINNWKEFFKPFRVDDTIVIKPTWEELNETIVGDHAPTVCSEEQLDLHRAIQQLRLEYREAICLHYLEGLSVKEISDVLGRNENTVKIHLARGREKLRKFLED